MTLDERNKLYVARCLLDGKMAISEAAEILSLSERQVKRIKKGLFVTIGSIGGHLALQAASTSSTFKKGTQKKRCSLARSTFLARNRLA